MRRAGTQYQCTETQFGAWGGIRIDLWSLLFQAACTWLRRSLSWMSRQASDSRNPLAERQCSFCHQMVLQYEPLACRHSCCKSCFAVICSGVGISEVECAECHKKTDTRGVSCLGTALLHPRPSLGPGTG